MICVPDCSVYSSSSAVTEAVVRPACSGARAAAALGSIRRRGGGWGGGGAEHAPREFDQRVLLQPDGPESGCLGQVALALVCVWGVGGAPLGCPVDVPTCAWVACRVFRPFVLDAVFLLLGLLFVHWLVWLYANKSVWSGGQRVPRCGVCVRACVFCACARVCVWTVARTAAADAAATALIPRATEGQRTVHPWSTSRPTPWRRCLSR